MIDDLVRDLKRDEGWREHAYQDHLGWWTIGYGFLVDERRGEGLPKHIAEEWLAYAATKRWNRLAKLEPWLLEQPESVQRAIANMAYQLGVQGVRRFKRMLAALQVNDRHMAAYHALDSHWAKEQTPKRAARIAKLIRGE